LQIFKICEVITLICRSESDTKNTSLVKVLSECDWSANKTSVLKAILRVDMDLKVMLMYYFIRNWSSSGVRNNLFRPYKLNWKCSRAILEH